MERPEIRTPMVPSGRGDPAQGLQCDAGQGHGMRAGGVLERGSILGLPAVGGGKNCLCLDVRPFVADYRSHALSCKISREGRGGRTKNDKLNAPDEMTSRPVRVGLKPAGFPFLKLPPMSHDFRQQTGRPVLRRAGAKLSHDKD